MSHLVPLGTPAPLIPAKASQIINKKNSTEITEIMDPTPLQADTNPSMSEILVYILSVLRGGHHRFDGAPFHWRTKQA
jgi:hypothetical protein